MAKGADCKSAGLRLRRFESYLPHQLSLSTRSAQPRSTLALAMEREGCTMIDIPGHRARQWRESLRRHAHPRASCMRVSTARAATRERCRHPLRLAHRHGRARQSGAPDSPLLATENALRRLVDEGITLPVAPDVVRPDAIAARLSPDAVHQGLLAEADPLPSPRFRRLGAAGIVLVLDQITDPHNVGAILRTAAAFAVAAIVTTARHSPEATGVLAKSASGALELVPIVTVQNLARALAEMKERGFSSSDSTAKRAGRSLRDARFTAPLALVLGAEGKGLRQGTRAVCDRLARLDLPGAIKSLNVSNAAALALYIASRALAA